MAKQKTVHIRRIDGLVYVNLDDAIKFFRDAKVDPGSMAAAHLEAVIAKLEEWREKGGKR